MSAVAAIFNVPGSPSEFAQWAFAHQAHHRDINRVIFQRTAVKIDEYILDPFEPNDSGVWLYQHQLIHQQMDPILGIQGYDLLDANFKDKEELAGWIWLNADEHYRAANVLGIG